MANDSMKKELVYPRIEENADRKQLLRELLKGNAAPLPNFVPLCVFAAYTPPR